jgi:hypothetical protein
MKPFVVNRYGRIVFPYNFFPALDFSVFETLEQFAAVIRRDFEEKAPSEVDIVARLESGAYKGRYELLRDLALDLFWVNRYPYTMYDKQPMRWRDVPRQRDDIFLPIFQPWEGGELTAAIETGYRNLVPSWDEGTASCSTCSATRRERVRSCRRSSRPWARSSRTPAISPITCSPGIPTIQATAGTTSSSTGTGCPSWKR